MDEKYGGYHYGGMYPYGPYPRQIAAADQTQILTGDGFKPLSHEQRTELARIAAESDFTFNGYQVVRREFFSHKFDPTLTIKNNSIIFNNSCISKLEQVVYVQFLINTTTEKLVIRPCAEGAKDAIRWCIAKADKRKSREISCRIFTEKLYDMMGWEELYRYKLQGTMIDYQGEKLYVFDLTTKEIYIPAVKEVSENGEARRGRPTIRFDANGDTSFGMSVEDHAASVDIDLTDGYGMVDVTPQQMPMEMIDKETGEVTPV